MRRKIIQVGNSWGVILPHSILELLKVNPVIDTVEFEIENDVLKIKKYMKPRQPIAITLLIVLGIITGAYYMFTQEWSFFSSINKR